VGKMTKPQAGILADMMPSTAAEVLRNFGRTNMDQIAGATVTYLKDMKLIERTKNLLTGELIYVLTADGKKVVKQLLG
jgi:hypothetical protein